MDWVDLRGTNFLKGTLDKCAFVHAECMVAIPLASDKESSRDDVFDLGRSVKHPARIGLVW